MSAAVPGEAELARAVEVLRGGGLVAFPTETVYGLGADARNEAAVARIYALKRRPATHPVIVHLSPEAALGEWAVSIPAPLAALAAAFWPGPLTLIVPRATSVGDYLTGGQDTIGLRRPAHPVAIALLRGFGGGIAAPSANRYGRISPTEAAHVRAEFKEQAPLTLDGGPCAIGLESTIVGVIEGRPALLRPGVIGAAAIAAIAGPLLEAAPGAGPRVSGSEASHYAPRTATRLVAEGAAGLLAGAGAGVLARRAAPAGFAGRRWLEAPPGALDYGRKLYASLRALDADGLSEIIVESVPYDPEWAAVRDRLERACRG